MWRSGVIAAAWVALAAPAAAQCVTAESLATGVQFTRQQGQQGWVQAAGNDLVQVDYRVGERGYQETVLLRDGVYAERYVDKSVPPGVIGVWSDTRTTVDIAGRPPVPVAGQEWATTIRLHIEGSDHSGTPISDRAQAQATYRFLPEQVVTLSGCQYRMIPVELTLANDQGAGMERSVYFPDLGFAIRTQYRDLRTGGESANGLTAMRPAG